MHQNGIPLLTGSASREGRPSKQPQATPLGAILAGIVAGIDHIGFSIALALLIFAGPLAGGASIGVAATLLSTIILSLALGIWSGLRTNIGHVQDIGVAVLAPALAGIVTSRGLAPQTAVATAFAIVGISSLCTGLLMFLIGRLGLGRLVRFFPQSVVAGFLAGTGWLLVVSGIAVAAKLGVADLFHPASWNPQAFSQLAPVIGFAVLLWVVLPRAPHPATLMLILSAAVIGCHAILWFAGVPPAIAQEMGWLPTAPAAGSLLDIPKLLPEVDWSSVAAASPTVAIVSVLNLLACLMNLSAVEAVTGEESDQNDELALTGMANVVVGLVAGPPGYSGLASSLLVQRISPGRRGAAFAMAFVLLLGLFAAQTLVTAVPVFVTSGLIVYLGMDLLRDWLVVTRERYSAAEWGIVLAIVGIVAFAGFIAALVVGLVIGVALFVFTYAQVQVVRNVHTLDRFRSTLDRDPRQAAVLRERGATVAVFELQGFIFFGTAEQLRTQLKQRLANPELPRLQRLILDFGQVTGVDSAALALIERIAGMTSERNIDLVLSRMAPGVELALRRTNVLQAAHVQSTATLDEAVESAEEMLLENPLRVVAPAEMVSRYGIIGKDAALLKTLFESLPVERLPQGTRLLSEGDPSDSILLLQQGRVTVSRRGENGSAAQRLRAMAAGAILGDIGMATRTQRSADVIAASEVVFRRLPATQMAALERNSPQVAVALSRLVMRTLAEKVVTANRVAES